MGTRENSRYRMALWVLWRTPCERTGRPTSHWDHRVPRGTMVKILTIPAASHGKTTVFCGIWCIPVGASAEATARSCGKFCPASHGIQRWWVIRYRGIMFWAVYAWQTGCSTKELSITVVVAFGLTIPYRCNVVWNMFTVFARYVDRETVHPSFISIFSQM